MGGGVEVVGSIGIMSLGCWVCCCGNLVEEFGGGGMGVESGVSVGSGRGMCVVVG